MATRKKSSLTVVPDGAKPPEPPKPAKPQTLAEAVESGDYLAILVAQRREMIGDLKDVSGPAKAALHRQIAIASKEIAALQASADQQAAEDAEAVADDEPFDAEAL